MQKNIGAACAVLMAGLVVTSVAGATPSLAQGATSWQGDKSGRVRLIAGARMPDGKLFAGLEFDLGEGWKTYWRVPGDSGVPSVFNWDGSQNVNSVKVHWPAPSRFQDKFGWNNGYKKDFVFPIEIKPKDPSKPIQLELLLYYGVCEELCIPGKASLSLSLPPEGYSGHQALIGRYLQMVPKPVDESSAVRVSSVSVEKASEGLNLEVTLHKRSSEPVTLFVEGPSAFYFDAPSKQSSDDEGMSRFRIAVDGAKAPADLKGKELKFTAVQGQLRLEQTWRVD